ncbi:hypothetical protein LLEC1_06297 [Akanthomyces lecanii]|uniref:Uncharacterized protein n=1 Tax=Cordyceps confragosa TaxID=2714763 RepID=A0A179IBE5_CORDF|nr:hypothetical protein LLEC1_06297 [Akanthomyces lecanii]
MPLGGWTDVLERSVPSAQSENYRISSSNCPGSTLQKPQCLDSQFVQGLGCSEGARHFGRMRAWRRQAALQCGDHTFAIGPLEYLEATLEANAKRAEGVPPAQILYNDLGSLSLKGEATEEVVRAKTDLESIPANAVAKNGDAVLRDTSLKANGRLYQETKRLGRSVTVVITRDKAKSELRLLGTERACDEAQARLAKLLHTQSLANSIHGIELGLEKLFWACQGGFKTVVAGLGPGKASFDIVSAPKRIITSGSWEDLRPCSGGHGSHGTSREASCTAAW